MATIEGRRYLWTMRKLLVEFIGTSFITTAVIGSALMASIWTKDGAIWLIVNMISTVSAIYISVVLFANISGANFNPVVTLVLALQRQISPRGAISYILSQLIGATFGAILAQTLFDRPMLIISSIDRSGSNIFVAEVVSSFGLVLIAIASWQKFKTRNRASLLGLWVASAYFFTSSTAFANPAITIGRMLTDSLAGISPASLITFIPAQFVGGLFALGLNRFLERTADAN